jgi:hypothetical protein
MRAHSEDKVRCPFSPYVFHKKPRSGKREAHLPNRKKLRPILSLRPRSVVHPNRPSKFRPLCAGGRTPRTPTPPLSSPDPVKPQEPPPSPDDPSSNGARATPPIALLRKPGARQKTPPASVRSYHRTPPVLFWCASFCWVSVQAKAAAASRWPLVSRNPSLLGFGRYGLVLSTTSRASHFVIITCLMRTLHPARLLVAIAISLSVDVWRKVC